MEIEPSSTTLCHAPDSLVLHRIYVASRQGAPFTRTERSSVIDSVSARFDGFTLSDALGFFRGRPIATLVIDIASPDTLRISALCRDLCLLLGQEEVGLVVGGQFQSIRA